MTRNKKIGIGALIIIVAFFAYSYLSHSNDAADTLLTGDTLGADTVGQDFIALLNELQGIKLDQSLFSDASFASLKDSSVTIAPQPVGRRNPFAPIGTAEGL